MNKEMLIEKLNVIEDVLYQIKQELLDKKTYCVYYHLLPNNKYYIGMCKNPEKRWKNGYGYRENKELNEDILKYGWKKIKHKIVYTTEDEKEAFKMEAYLIYLYNSANPKYGYNKRSPLGKRTKELSIEEKERYIKCLDIEQRKIIDEIELEEAYKKIKE